MFKIFVTTLLISFSSVCFSDVDEVERDWLGLDKRDSWMFYAGTGLLLIDTLQSRYIGDRGNSESNIFQGKHPSRTVLYTYNASMAVIHYMINRFASLWLKYPWNAGLFSIEIYAIKNNHDRGLRIKMNF